MVFSSVVFVFVFLPLALVVHTVLLLGYTLAFKSTERPLGEKTDSPYGFWLCNVFLLLVSLVFYAWGEPYHVITMIASAAVNYSFGLLLAVADDNRTKRKFIMIISVVFNLGLLGYYKYMNLFVDSGGVTLLNMLLPVKFSVSKIALPLGISFYTFQAMSYVFDVYNKNVKPTTSFVTFSCYLTMFPQLVAGPIVRYSTIEKELHERTMSVERFAMGISRFIFGLAKKLLIADTLAQVANAAFAVPTRELPAYAAWAGVAAYAFQIYYDFSGYSDMAVGMGHMFGFTFPENFYYPYIARSMQDYWRRWHMSLSRWFRDYLFIPLGGSRKGLFITGVNLLLVFALCGLWHGASWIFLAWGLYHGFFLALERIFPRFAASMPRWLSHLYVTLAFLMGWVLFRANNFTQAYEYYKALLGFYDAGINVNSVRLALFKPDVYLAFTFGVIGAAPIVPWMKTYFNKIASGLPSPVAELCYACRVVFLLLLLLVCCMPLFGATYVSFIYFRF